MALTKEQIETMRGWIKQYYRTAGHEKSQEMADRLCDLALLGLVNQKHFEKLGNPYVLMYKDSDGAGVVCRLEHGDLDHRGYGLLAVDLIRHAARYFKVSESEIWKWVDRERDKPTTDYRGGLGS